jgi:cytochrome c biogenesis factor
MGIKEFTGLIHPALAVAFVFPLIGVVVYLSLQTRDRRLQAENKVKSKISPLVGTEHLRLGRWLTTSIVVLTLIGMLHPVVTKMIEDNTWASEPRRVIFVAIMFVLTPVSLGLLYQAKTKAWRATFATLTGMGLVIIGCQPEIFRRGYEWYTSHYYYGITASLLMVLSLAVVPDIYQDKQKRWRRAHAFLNMFATLLFMGQGFTGARDLFEIGLYMQPPGLIISSLL